MVVFKIVVNMYVRSFMGVRVSILSLFSPTFFAMPATVSLTPSTPCFTFSTIDSPPPPPPPPPTSCCAAAAAALPILAATPATPTTPFLRAAAPFPTVSIAASLPSGVPTVDC
jgi:hypothetical protein